MKSTQRSPNNTASWWMDFLFITLTLGGLFFTLLGNRPLFVPDEGRYAEIAREMVSSGNFITPFLNGIHYFEKPILFYWLVSAAIKTMGLSLWTVRSVNAVISLLGCLLTYFTARSLFDRQTGLLAAFILGTNLLYFVMTHMVSLDLPVTVFISASLYAFILGNQTTPGIKRRLYFWGAAAAAALAVLTKGLIGIVFPCFIVGAFITLMLRKPLYYYIPSSILVFLLIAAPWHILVNQHNPGFFQFYFIEQHFLRYATLDIGHYQPAWFFIPCLLLGFFPWIVFLPQSLLTQLPTSWKNRQQHQTELFFILWAVIIFTFFSFSKSKLIPYILPVFPALAILTARYLSMGIQQSSLIGIKIGFFCQTLCAVMFAYVLYHFTRHSPLPDPVLASRYLDVAALILLLGSIASCLLSFRQTLYAILMTIISTSLFLMTLIAAMPAVDARTILPFANILKPILKPQDEVITYRQYYQDLPFYLERRVTIVAWQNELSYGMKQQDTSDWMIDIKTFWQRWQSPNQVYAIMDIGEYDQLLSKNPAERFFVLGKTPNNILISNHKISTP